MRESHEIRRNLLNGPYRVERVLGSGGMARVHLGRRIGASEETPFALKRLLPHLASSPRFVRMFCREAVLGSRLVHPNIVGVVDFGEQDHQLMLVTEFVDGTSCARLLRKVVKRGEAFPAPVALFIAAGVLNALAYAHELRDSEGQRLDVVHRDVSPGNILLGATGEVKLSDFGVALVNDRMRDTRPGMVKGKLAYMSPEQARNSTLDERSDLFSVGVVLFETLTGTPLFTGVDDYDLLARVHEGDLSPVANARTIPLELRLILATALARDPGERFRNAKEFSKALQAFARHYGISAVRNPLIGWLRQMEVWPLRSGAYRRVGPVAPRGQVAKSSRRSAGA